MVEIPDPVFAELAEPVASALPHIVARIPATPAAELGRLRAIADGETWPTHGPPDLPWAMGEFRSPQPEFADSPVRNALDSLPSLLIERLLGALELTVPEVDLAGAPELTGFLGAPFTGNFGMVRSGEQSEAITGAAVLDHIRPGAVPLVAALARRLASHPRVAPQLAVRPGITDEPGVAAAHGAGQLALAVATAAAVLYRVGIHPWATKPAAVLGVAIGTAVLLLREAPMPAGYAAALLARARAEYLMPRQSGGSAPVSGHRFALLEGTDVPEVDFSSNGLVAVVPGGAVIRTGIETGHVRIQLSILEEPPPVALGWDEIVEVSWQASVGGASVIGPQACEPRLRRATPPWPGDYRLRVHARGRDTDEYEGEEYELVVWQAPAAPEAVYARADRLGGRLRGEPEPVRPERPETAYRWLRDSALAVAATVTVVTEVGVADVLRAFGADPARPESMQAIDDFLDEWVAVLDIGGAVLAVEFNGWQGSTEEVLSRASAGGRAASMYWNVNALTRLSFAEHGQVLLSEEPFDDLEAPPAVAPALAGLDFGDHRRGKPLMGMLAVQRFTGHGITAEDLARIEDADIGFRITAGRG